MQSKDTTEGEKPHLIVRGTNQIHDKFIEEILHLPEKTNVFHLETKNIIPPIEFIGGREVRSIGDTCRMFYKVERFSGKCEYFFWDGIVSEKINELGSHTNADYEITNRLWDAFGGKVHEDSCGLSTGRTDYKVVLTEKIKKPSIEESF